MHKGLIFQGWTRETIIRYGIMIPAVGQDKPGEIIMGYIKPTKVAQFLERRFWRRPYYKYFDTHERPNIPIFRCPELGNLSVDPLTGEVLDDAADSESGDLTI